MVLYSLCVFYGIRLICDDLHRLATYRLFVSQILRALSLFDDAKVQRKKTSSKMIFDYFLKRC